MFVFSSLLCFSYDHAHISLYEQLGTVDLRACAKFHRYFKRVAVFLRHIWSIQRCCKTLRPDHYILEVLAILCQPFHVLDWWIAGRDIVWSASSVC